MSQNHDGKRSPNASNKPNKDATEKLASDMAADALSVGLRTPIKSHAGGAAIANNTTVGVSCGHAGRFALASKVIGSPSHKPSKQGTLTQMGIEVMPTAHVNQNGYFVLEGDNPSTINVATNIYANKDSKVVINGALAYSGPSDHPLYDKAVKDGRKLWAKGGCSYVVECPGLPINLRNGVEEYIERMADAIDHGLAIEPFCSNVIEHIEKRRARGKKYDSEEDLDDAAKMPHEFDYSSPEEDVTGKDEGDDYETPPRKKRRCD